MVEQRPSHDLSPQLCAVLSSLNVSLESELNRYRRNRRLDGVADEDLFADLDEAIFGSDLSDGTFEGSTFESSIVPLPLAMPAASPPPVPRNKRLLSAEQTTQATSNTNPLDREDSNNFGLEAEQVRETEQASHQLAMSAGPLSGGIASNADYAQLASQRYGTQGQNDSEQLSALSVSEQSVAEQKDLSFAINVAPGSLVATTNDPTTHSEADTPATPTGYLASSEKLIESLEDVPPLPEPIKLDQKPKRKTVSLLAGASLGFLGLVAGLGASYLMANPAVTQRLASRFQRQEPQVATNQPASSFDPPGPDLSANEFIDLEFDNLSSLKMPSTGVNPNLAAEGAIAPSATTALPPIQQSAAPTAPAAVPVAPPAASTPSPAIETQAVVVPVGLTYYVTAPFTTQQDLLKVRESISEAFVRQFVNGNQIQIAAFDNPQAAQQFVQELADQQITAQIYGPTAE